MIAADELSGSLEEVYLLRSPINANRSFAAMEGAQTHLSETVESTSVEGLRSELEAELVQEKAS